MKTSGKKNKKSILIVSVLFSAKFVEEKEAIRNCLKNYLRFFQKKIKSNPREIKKRP
jgi:hypothetical protein